MAQTGFTPIQTYYSTTASAVPAAGNLLAGELAINTVDEKLFFKNSSGVVKQIASTAATGDVTLNGVQTLTNKTIAFSSNTLTGVAGTTATQTLTNKTITNLVFDGNYTEDVYAIVDGASVDLNPANGTVQTWTLGASRSPTATSFASGQSLTLMIDDGTAYAITWPSVVWKTNAGVAPTLNATGLTAIQLWKVSTVLYGARVGDA